MNQPLLRFVLRVIIFIIKTGQVNNVLRTSLWVIKSKMDYDEGMARIDGSYFDKQVKAAAQAYQEQCHQGITVGVSGFSEWNKENPE